MRGTNIHLHDVRRRPAREVPRAHGPSRRRRLADVPSVDERAFGFASAVLLEGGGGEALVLAWDVPRGGIVRREVQAVGFVGAGVVVCDDVFGCPGGLCCGHFDEEVDFIGTVGAFPPPRRGEGPCGGVMPCAGSCVRSTRMPRGLNVSPPPVSQACFRPEA